MGTLTTPGRAPPERVHRTTTWETGNKAPARLHMRIDVPGLKPKNLLMMPARVAMALQADGWWLRSEIIWHKPKPHAGVSNRPSYQLA